MSITVRTTTIILKRKIENKTKNLKKKEINKKYISEEDKIIRKEYYKIYHKLYNLKYQLIIQRNRKNIALLRKAFKSLLINYIN